MLISFVGFHILNKQYRIGAFHVWLSTFYNWVELTIIYHFSVNSKKNDENVKQWRDFRVCWFCHSLLQFFEIHFLPRKENKGKNKWK